MLAPPRTAPIELGKPMMRASATSSLEHYTMSLDFLASTPMRVAPRPKLSLDISFLSTSSQPSSLTSPSQSHIPPQYQKSPRYHKSSLAMRPHPSSLCSPSSSAAPYVLPLGSKSILRNGPLPRRMASATSARGSRRLFPAPKRVVFREALTEIVPAPAEVLSAEESGGSFGSSSSDDGYAGLHSSMRTALGHSPKRRKMWQGPRAEDAEGKTKKSPGMEPQHRQKRSKDWMWTTEAWDDVQLYESPEEGAPPLECATSKMSSAAKENQHNRDSTPAEELEKGTLDTSATNGGLVPSSGHEWSFSSERTTFSSRYSFPPNPLRFPK